MITRTMDYWLNIDLSTRIAKLHKETCRYCTPYEQSSKPINQMNTNGGWFEFESPKEAQRYYHDKKLNLFWQPCKVCKPE
jgi:hypothetical protein